MEIKNKLTVIRGETGGDNGLKKGKGQVKELVQKAHGQGQWDEDCL